MDLTALWLTLRLATCTTAILLVVGVPLAWWLAQTRWSGRVFMGDAGSVPLGLLVGGSGIGGWRHGVWPVWFPLMVFSPFVVDATVTLMRRALRRERFWHPHRDHYYQRLVRMGWSHRRVALTEYGLMAACGISALAMLQANLVVQVAGLAAWCCIYAAAMLSIDRLWVNSDASRGVLA